MATQGPVSLTPVSPLATNDTTSNVAVNQQVAKDLRAANVDGKDIYPSRVFTKDLALETALTVGSGVSIGDGEIVSDMLAADSVTTAKIDAGAVTATEISTGAVTSTKINVSDLANIASIYTGSITVGTSGTIGSASTGGWFTPSRLLMKNSGTTKVDLNTTANTYYFAGEVVASKITIAENAANSCTFGADMTVNGDLILTENGTPQYIKYTDATSGNKWIYGNGNWFDICHAGASGVIHLQARGTTIPDTSKAYVKISTDIELNATSSADIKFSKGGTAYYMMSTGESSRHVLKTTTLSVSVTSTGGFATGTWTHGWNTGTQTVRFFATAQDYDTTKVTGISNVRVERTSATTCKVEFLVATYTSTATVTFDVMGIGPA